MSLEGFERTLLESGGGDAPPAARRAAARAAVLRAAGVAAAVAGATLTSTSTSTSATAAGPGAGAGAAATATATATTTTTTTTAIGLKVVLLALLSVGVASTAIVVATRGARPSETQAAREVGTRMESPAAAAPVPLATATTSNEVFSIGNLPSATASATARRATPPRDPLAVEAGLLEAARACLASEDAACARARLTEHRARFAHGVLAAEADVLSVRLSKLETERGAAEEKR